MNCKLSKRISLRALSLLILLSLSACDRSSTTEMKLKSLCSTLNISYDDYDHIALINVDACPSCSDTIKGFLAINTDNPNLLVILSSLSVKKAGFVFEGYDGKPTIVVDRMQSGLKKHFLVNSKPIIYKKIHGNIVKREYKLPEFEKLWLQNEL